MPFSEYSEKLLKKWTRKALIYKGFPEARVEMKVAPFRALTQFLSFPLHTSYFRRNEGRPIQGIDTSSSIVNEFTITSVEMKVAPFRALILI